LKAGGGIVIFGGKLLKKQKERLDVIMSDRGLCESRSQAQSLIMAGQVRINGQVVIKPSVHFFLDVEIEVDQGPKYVSRGGEKLAGALRAFSMEDLSALVCVDIGASTGGFTDCLLQSGAMKVYAVDVGYGVLHWKMRNHPGVISMERTNARYVTGFPERINLVTVDASFISLRVLLPVIKSWFSETGGYVIPLIKPQFEAGRSEVARGDGVVRDPSIHRKVLLEVLGFAIQLGFGVKNLIRSPLVGPKGNAEFLALLELPGDDPMNLEVLVENVFL
jgi:23S rRNA (cytidine1920-2'-O)/16S rRNA (cytidine1409-2'-O)-methyltransferase